MTTQKTLTVLATRVLIARAPLVTTITGPDDYDAWEAAPNLTPIVLEDRPAPAYARAKFSINLALAAIHAWQWDQVVETDDRLAIQDKATGRILFAGFVVDVCPTWSDKNESVIVTAVANAYWAARCAGVVGRWMRRKDDTATVLYLGAPCRFNAGGLPNKGAIEAITGGPVEGVYTFAPDGHPSANWWTLRDIVAYFCCRCNPSQTWLRHPLEWPPEGEDKIEVDCEGLSLWDALGAAADRAGYDCYEEFGEAGQDPYCGRLKFVKRSHGKRITIQRQAAIVSLPLPALDLRETNLFASSISEDATAAVTRPIVVGGADLVQITVPLQPAWDPDRLVLAATDYPPEPDITGDYAKRYLTDGEDFAAYSDVGRLWVANEDGAFSDAPWNCTKPDMAAIAGDEAGSWPLAPLAPRDLLSSVSYIINAQGVLPPPSQQPIIDVSFDEGESWQRLAECRVLPDRLGVMLTASNLGAIQLVTPWADDEPHDLFSALAEADSKVRMRLTCTIESPSRYYSCPDRIDGAGTGLETSEVFDRGALGQRRRIAASCVIGSALVWGDLVDYRSKVDAEGIRLQTALQSRRVDGNLNLESIDLEINLTDVVEKISGIDYDLGGGIGMEQYPRIVGRFLHFDNSSLTIVLGSERKAPTWWRPAQRVWEASGKGNWVTG